MPIKFILFLGRGSGLCGKGGWKCQFYFYGRGDFSDSLLRKTKHQSSLPMEGGDREKKNRVTPLLLGPRNGCSEGGRKPQNLAENRSFSLKTETTDWRPSPYYQGQKSAQGILRLRNPNSGPNSVKQILDARMPAGHPPLSSFSSFHGVRAAKPLCNWLECRFVIFAIFVKNPLFLAGQKHP